MFASVILERVNSNLDHNIGCGIAKGWFSLVTQALTQATYAGSLTCRNNYYY